jgi:hypothetical protein
LEIKKSHKNTLTNYAVARANAQKAIKNSKTKKNFKKLSFLKTAKPESYKKDGKYIIKRLANVNKGATFAPATTTNVP